LVPVRSAATGIVERSLRSVVHAAIGKLGLEVRRTRPGDVAPPPTLFDDPFEALHRRRGGERAAFLCPLRSIRVPNGFSLADDGWHPMVAALDEHAERGVVRFEDSILRTYFEVWQPATALDALVGFRATGPNGLSELPSHLLYLQPWVAHDAALLDWKIRDWHRADIAEHGGAPRSLEEDGFNRHGPVSEALGALEFNRLIGAFGSLRAHGFDRARGDVGCKILRRGTEVRFLLQGGGNHRAAALRAMGVEFVPAQFPPNQPDLIDVDDVDFWPQVRTGMWTAADARRYVHHLFDFDERNWASNLGLVSTRTTGQASPSSLARDG
jgi:hypothetical protein